MGSKKGSGPGRKKGKHKKRKKRKKKKSNQFNKTNIEARIFLTDKTKKINGRQHNKYKIILRSEQNLEPTDIQLVQKADSGEEALFKIAEAKYSTGESIYFNAQKNKNKEIIAYRLNDIKIPCELEVYVNEPFKSSFKVN
jgi:hypothetical protein